MGETDSDCHFGGVWSRDKVGQAQHVEELLARQPLALAYDFILHQCDMGRGTAKPDRSWLEEQHGQVAQALAERALDADRGSGCVWGGHAKIVACGPSSGAEVSGKSGLWRFLGEVENQSLDRVFSWASSYL